jgi:hypothetical protein
MQMFYLIKFKDPEAQNGAKFAILSTENVEIHLLNDTDKRVYQNNNLIYQPDNIAAIKLLNQLEVSQAL